MRDAHADETTKIGDTNMTTPKVTEIRSSRQAQLRLADIERGSHEYPDAFVAFRDQTAPLRHNYDALTPVDMAAYRRRCAEIRTLDERADRAREV